VLGNTLACRTTASLPVTTKYTVFGVKSRGDHVRRFQQLLLGAGVPVPVDGVFGTRTAQAMATYRTARGLAQSPVTDDGVWADLLARTGAQATSMRR
jgi:peptidoglycan hydrolase-like protein with peptidoglycan-binding domain